MPTTRRRALQLGAVFVVAPGCGPERRDDDAGRPPASLNPDYVLARITPTDDFYIQSYAEIPTVDETAWRLTFDGLVAAPRETTLDGLRMLALVDKEHTLQCIGASPRSAAIGNALWRGLPLADALTALDVVVDTAAAFLHVTSIDGYQTSLPRSDLDDGRIFLALDMNGVPLPSTHGFPARLLVSNRYGMKSPKWIERVTFAAEQLVGTWEARGWSQDAVNRAAAFVHLPSAGVYDSPLHIVGSAFCGDSPIVRVELSGDDGATWEEAELALPGLPDVWTTWRFPFTPRGLGTYTFLVRCTAEDGRTTNPTAEPDLAGYQGYGRVAFEVVPG